MLLLGTQRKKAIQSYRNRIEEFSRGIPDGHYSWINSELDGLFLRSFQTTFENIPSFKKMWRLKNISLSMYIETILKEKKGKAVGIEFGGPGSRLFNGFTKGFFLKS